MSHPCTKLLVGDLSRSVATGRKPDIAQKARTVAIDPEQTRHRGQRPAGPLRLLHSQSSIVNEKRGSIMSAYFVVQATISDEPRYQKYREAVVPFIAKFGGKFAARGAKVEVL